ncbi:MAG: hypothetical protein M3R15_28060 [Acidobacteriota bacterium]|nr:hypothetical protein [Acidobacteriota bacterium]
MKLKIMIVIVLIAAAWAFGRTGGKVTPHDSSPFETRTGREETRQSYQLASGARIEVSGINGPVKVETADTDTAEVHIISSASNPSDLDHHKIIVEQTLNSLNIHGKNKRSWWRKLWSGGANVHQQVTLRIPRRSDLMASGVNGSVTVGEIEGAVHVSGINGRVEVAPSIGASEVHGVNGPVSLGVGRLNEQGVSVNGVNGAVELRFGESVNADLSVDGLNGTVSSGLSNMIIEEQPSRSSLRARIGTGGAPIDISGVNGRVRLESTTREGQQPREK